MSDETYDPNSEPEQADAGDVGPGELLGGGTQEAQRPPDQVAQPQGAFRGTPQQTAPAIPDERWKFAGREFSNQELEQLYGKADVLKNLLVQQEQAGHFQKKYNELLEESRKRDAAIALLMAERQRLAQEQATKQQPQKPISPEEWKNLSVQKAKLLVDAGYFSQDTVEAIPDVVSVLVHLLEENLQTRNFMQQVGGFYQTQLAPMMQQGQRAQKEAAKQSLLGYLHQKLHKISESSPHFAPLASAETRAQFIAHLQRLNPEIGLLMGQQADDFLRREFIALNSDALLQAVAQASASQQAQTQARRQVAAGEAGGGRSAAGSRSIKNADILSLFARG